MDPAFDETTRSDYAQAFRSVKAAKNIFWWLILAAIVIQLAGFVLVDFFGVLDHSKGQYPVVVTTDSTPKDNTETATTALESEDADGARAAEMWHDCLGWALPATKFLGLVSAVLLVATLALAVKLALVGRIGGISGFIAAFFWALVLLAIVTPWQQIVGSTFATGSLFNLGDLVREATMVKTSWGADEPSFLSRALYYARFIAFPLVAVLVLIATQIRFARGYRQTGLLSHVEETPAEPPIRPIQ